MRTLYQQQAQSAQFEQHQPQAAGLIRMGLKRLGQVVIDFWEPSSKEPRVRQKIDRSGNLYWQVYDPLQDCVLRFDDEQNVMVWLEEQHHRQSRQVWNLG